IGPDPRNFNQRVSLGRNDLLIRTFPYSSWRLKGRNMQAIHHVEKFHPKDFDFIALSLAQMNSQGRKVDVEQVTGSMNDACKSRFLDSYRYHLNLFVEKSPS
ncbi:hypothetical protein, partial [Klebsiella pneumoniae]|uniref:hypothetical protein n=1 Tax=Klebsiella pneumoniae TaxID=573 RepID=UPI00211AF690